MAIKTSTFGGVTLTGSAAKAFKKQFLRAKASSNPLAQTALDQGRVMLQELKQKGFVTIKRKKKDG